MGKKAKTSRKGKKAWRANIKTDDIDNFFEKSTKEALTGGSLADVETDSLFFVDKSKDLSVKRKIEKHREKVLRCDSVLQKNTFVQAVPSSTLKKCKKKNKNKKDSEAKDSTQDVSKNGAASGSGMADIWENEGECDDKARKISKPSVIPAVEVEPSGCSFNPSFEAHQDSLAQAVATEMQKVYQNELGPQPVPLTVPGQVIDEEDMYFLDADNGNDDDDDDTNEKNEDSAQEQRSNKKKRVTRVELNKRARRKEQEKKEAEAKKKQGLSKEIDCLPDIIQEIAKEDEEKHKRNTRRLVAKQERLKARPPRLGKHKDLKEIETGVSLLEILVFVASDKAEMYTSWHRAREEAAYLCRLNPRNVQSRISSSPFGKRDELSVEEDAERKIGWLLKLIFVGTATFVGYQFFPYMGDNMLQQSVSLLHVKDPFFKRSGASRLARFAIDDERRMKIVEIGGAQELLNMLEAAKDDSTRKVALKALAALSQSDEAVGALHHSGAISVIKSISDSTEEAEIEKFKASLLKRFQDLRYDNSS
ncbi:unnamed protein product [Dovyalis caffra]|uniref:Ribosome biogenesis protein NOP53 n=1 Tax=Dovyalis caffra TaxID=77055 RepID=A0AAV1QY28_9ROSI|nr:unnamed protein product [Dovyalis caffra]